MSLVSSLGHLLQERNGGVVDMRVIERKSSRKEEAVGAMGLKYLLLQWKQQMGYLCLSRTVWCFRKGVLIESLCEEIWRAFLSKNLLYHQFWAFHWPRLMILMSLKTNSLIFLWHPGRFSYFPRPLMDRTVAIATTYRLGGKSVPNPYIYTHINTYSNIVGSFIDKKILNLNFI